MKKGNLLIPLLMAIVMMAMSPTKVWADETLVSDHEEDYSANDTKITVTYNQTGSKAVLRFKDYDKYLDRYWSSLNLKIDSTEVLNLNDLWSDLTSSIEKKHTTIVNNTTLAANEKSITLNGITIGTAKLQNRSYDTFYCYTELALNFNQYFSYYGHELTLTGTYKVTSSGFRRINLTGYMNGYPRPKSLTAIKNGTDVNLSWESEKYNDNTTTAGSWYIYRGTTQLGSVAYGTTSYTDTGWSCSAENKYTVVFVPTDWTAKADYLGINASKSITIPHTYGDPTWEWTGNESATCSRTCTNTNCTAETTDHTVSATVTLGEGGITSAVTTPATCLAMGKTTYTAKATVLGTEYTDAKIVTDIPAAGHTYGEPVWTWAEDYESATCTLTCTACTEGTEGHTASADVTLGGGGITYAVTTPPQCTETGTGTYTATATVAGSEYSDHKDKDLPATGHTIPENYDEYGIKLCSVCFALLEYQPLGEADADGWYSIVNPRQLNDFATKVNNGETNIKGRLTWDIDILGREYVQIGNTADNAFSGILDGQFHTIRTLNINTSEENGAALIRYTKNATIKNLTVQGTFNTSNKYAAGFIAQNLSDGDDTHYTKIEKCISAVNIISSRSGDGTHAGFVGVAGAPVTLSDCAFIGSITTTNGTNNCAALVGWSSNGDKSTATNCFVTATFDSGICQKQMMRNCSDDHFPTCYYVNTYCDNTVHQGTQITPAQVSNGYLCYLLNGGVNAKTDGTQTWYQDIKKDEDDLVFDNLPVLKRTKCNTVYCTYGETCTDVTFNNTGASGTPNHEYNIAWSWAKDGRTAKATHTCQRNSSHVVETVATMTSQQTLAPTCGDKGKTTYTASVNVIGTVETDTKIMADIPATGNHTLTGDYNSYGFKLCSSCQKDVPMPLSNPVNGWYSISHAGHLASFANKVNGGETDIKGRLANDIDMQGQTLVQIGEDPDVPFQGELDGQFHAIKNLSISADEEYKASLIGYSDGVTIQKLTVQGNINTSAKYAAGFIGQNNNNKSVIKKCFSDVNIVSTVAGDGTHSGFVSVANKGVEISNCAFVGSITSETGTTNCTALVGWDTNRESKAESCYTSATFSKGTYDGDKLFIRNNGNWFYSCYYLQHSMSTWQGRCLFWSNNALASGELCYLLNGEFDYKSDGTQAWYQKIGTDPRPVLTAATDNTVYCVYGSDCCDRTYNNTAGSGTPVHPYNSFNNPMKWTWADDLSSATVTYNCSKSGNHTPNVAATITTTVPIPATCTMTGKTTYTATINIQGNEYTDSKTVENLAVLDHNLTSTADDEIMSCTLCNKKIMTATKVSVSQNSSAIEAAQIEHTDARPVFQFKDGKVVMTLGDGDGSAHIAEMPLAEGAKMTIKGVTYNEETNKTSLSVSSAGYATFSSAFQLTVPDNENVAIHAPKMKDDNILINNETKLPANTVVPAGTGLLIKGNEGNYDILYSSAEAPEVTSVLTASVVARPKSDFSDQILALGIDSETGKVGFFSYSGETTGARKAFFLLPTGGQARVGIITDDVTTAISQDGISSLPVGESQGGASYNLAGQRVSKNTRGIIIINGKKYINN